MIRYLTKLFKIILVGIILILTSFYLALACSVRLVIEDKNDKS